MGGRLGDRTAGALVAVESNPATMAIVHHWQPQRTHVFAVGVLQYADKVHWPLEGRRDAVLIETLEQRGVPPENITFLKDAEATTAAFEAAFVAHLQRTAPGDQLFVYYAGHGARDEKHGRGSFKLRDARLPVSAIFAWIERHFRGEMAILTADCCYSGSLALEAPMRAGRVAYAALGSSLSTETSTGAWTFTNCWIDALLGRVFVDLDADGVLRLDELARYAERRLSVIDGQVCSFAVANGFPSTFALAKATPRVHPRQGQFIEARQDSKWCRAEILDARDQTLELRWVDDDTCSSVDEQDVRTWCPPELTPGEPVSVKHAGQCYPAVVLAARHGMHLVRFDAWDESWDEWISPDRIEGLVT